jgi:hypothetical protein
MRKANTLSLDDMTACLKQYMGKLGIEEKYIHIEYNIPRDSIHPTSGSLLLPIYGIEVDSDVYSLLYGLKFSNNAPFVELCNRDARKLKRGYDKDIHTTEDMTLFLQSALRSTTTLHTKVDNVLDQLDRILQIVDPPRPLQPKVTPKPANPPPPPQKPPSWWGWS